MNNNLCCEKDEERNVKSIPVDRDTGYVLDYRELTGSLKFFEEMGNEETPKNGISSSYGL